MRTLPEINALRNALEDLRGLIWDLQQIRGMQRQVTNLRKLEQSLDDELNAALIAQADEVLTTDGGRYL